MILYTREALQLIRSGAGPAELGWSQSMYESVCRRNAIPIRCSDSQQHPKPADVAAAAVRSSALLQFDIRTGEVSRGAACVTIVGHRRLTIFEHLLSRLRAGDTTFCRAAEIRTLMPTINDVAHSIAPMNLTLAPLRCAIEHRKGPGGGYRLVIEP